MRRLYWWCAPLAALGLAAAAAAQVESSDKGEEKVKGPDPAEWAPAEALAFVGITDTQGLWKDLQKTADYQAMQDEDFQDEGSKFRFKIIENLRKSLARLVDMDPDELKSPFGGPLAFYVVAPPGAGLEDAEPVLIAGVGDGATMQTYLANLVTKLKDAAGSYESVAAAEHTIHTFKDVAVTEAEDEEDADEELDEFGTLPGPFAQLAELENLNLLEQLPSQLAICLAQDRLIVAKTAERVKVVLSGASGGEKLADGEDYGALRQHLRPVGDLRLLVNIPRLLELAKARQTDEEAGEFRDWLRVLGAGSLKSMVGHVRLGTKSYDSKFDLLFLMKGERTGLAKLLSMENRPVEPPAWVPDATAFYLNLNVNPPKLVDQIIDLVAQSDPDEAQQMRVRLEQMSMGEQQVNLRKDLIEHFTGPLVLAAGVKKPVGPGAGSLVLALGHRNKEAVGRGLSPFLAGAAPRDVQGAQVFPVPLPLPLPLGLGLANEQVYLGLTPTVEAAVAASSNTAGLAREPGFRRARRFVPEEAWAVMFLDMPKLTAAIIELSQKSNEVMGDPVLGQIAGMLQMSGANFSDEKTNRKRIEYSTATIMTIATTPDGVRMTAVALRPGADEEE